MDKIKQYQNYIHNILDEYKKRDFRNPDVETQLLIDDENGHYYIMRIGWDNRRRIHACPLHIDIKNEKIWIQQDWSEEGIATELLELGIPKEDIVLAFHAPYKRPYTGFAIA